MDIVSYSDIAKAAESLGLELYVDLDQNIGGFCKISPRTQERMLKYGYRYKSAERMFTDLSMYIQNAQSIKEINDKLQAEPKIEKQKIEASIKVGDVFVYLGGWGQTDINFYEVVARKGKKTVVTREISRLVTDPKGQGQSYEYVVPSKGAFIGDEHEYRLTGGTFNVNSHSRAYLITDPTKSFYRSWGY